MQDLVSTAGLSTSPDLASYASIPKSTFSYLSIPFRSRVCAQILQQAQADNVLFFDDLDDALSPSQRPLLANSPGYCRCFVPAAEFCGIAPVHVVSRVAPLAAEIDFVIMTAHKFGGMKSEYHLWVPDPLTRELVDIVNLYLSEGKDSYTRRFHKLGAGFSIPTESYADIIRALKDRDGLGRTLVLPFQCKSAHETAFSKLIATGAVVLPSSAELFVDKIRAAEALVALDPSIASHLTAPVGVQLSRDPISLSCDSAEVARLLDFLKVNSAEQTEQSVTLGNTGISINSKKLMEVCADLRFDQDSIARRIESFCSFYSVASQILNAMRVKESSGIQSYLKLDAAGVSGLDNIVPSTYPEVYSGSQNDRINSLALIIASRFSTAQILPRVAIEDRISRANDQFGCKEYTVSGFLTLSKFNLWSVVRSINTANDIFTGQFGCGDPNRIGISLSDHRELVAITEHVAELMRKSGYHLGYVAKDFMWDSSNQKMRLHDHNDRRGGRTVLERLISIFPEKVFMDSDFEFQVPAGKEAILYASQISEVAQKLGIYAYGTPLAYFPKQRDGQSFFKIKLIAEVPTEVCDESTDVASTMRQLVYDQLFDGL